MSKSPIDILKEAILLEKRGKAFYSTVAEQSRSQAAKKIFLMMAEEEDEHIKFLAKQFKAYTQDKKFVKPDQYEEDPNEETVIKILSEDIKKEITADPIAHFSFDKEPTEAEIKEAFTKLRAYDNIGYRIPRQGEKIVTIQAKTGTGKYDGTDDGALFKVQYDFVNVVFNLDDTNRDDQERGNVDVFFYLVNTGEPWDELRSAEIIAKGSDGWKCDYVSIREEAWKNFTGEAPDSGKVNTRFELFDFYAFIETDGNPTFTTTTDNRLRLDLK